MAFVGTRDDLKKVHFKVLPGLGYGPRMVVAAALVAAGIALQLGGTTGFLVVGAAVVFGGILLTLVDSKTNAPEKVRGPKTWERVTPEEFGRVQGLVDKGKAWARRDLFGAYNALGCVTFVLLALGLLAGWALLREHADDLAATIWLVDGGMFLILTYAVGARRAWRPGDLLIKVQALERILAEQAARPIPRLTFQPMLEVQRDPATDRRLPTDARLLVTVDQGPEDLIGTQVQCSINRVGNTAYPYLYAVIIARKGLALAERLRAASVGPKEVLTFEHDDPEVDVAVLRQRTTKTSGYHTTPADQLRVFQQAVMMTLWLANLPDLRKGRR